MIILSILCALFYIYNEQFRICENIPIIGLYRCMPFFIIGHLCKQKRIIPLKRTRFDLPICIIGIGTSLITSKYLFNVPSCLINHALIYISAFVAVIGTLGLCRLLENFHSSILDNISIGTIVIMGLHWMLIGTTNFTFQKILHIDGGITYPLYITILLTLAFEAIIYPIILLFKNKYPFLLGKKEEYRVDIIRGEDGSMALSLKKYGKIKFVYDKRCRAITGYGTIGNTSMWQSFIDHVKIQGKGITRIFYKKDHYEDSDDNLVKK